MLITKDLVSIPAEGNDKETIIRNLAEIAYAQGKVEDKEKYVTAVLKREEEYSTAVGFHVAIPHGKTDAVKSPFFMYGKVDKVDWKALDGEPVDHVFLIGVPDEAEGKTHLQILAKLSRKLMKSEFREELVKANTPDELIKVLEANELV